MLMTQTSKVDIHESKYNFKNTFLLKNKLETTRFRYKQLHVGR